MIGLRSLAICEVFIGRVERKSLSLFTFWTKRISGHERVLTIDCSMVVFRVILSKSFHLDRFRKNASVSKSAAMRQSDASGDAMMSHLRNSVIRRGRIRFILKLKLETASSSHLVLMRSAPVMSVLDTRSQTKVSRVWGWSGRRGWWR